jgi:hypothetical protein
MIRGGIQTSGPGFGKGPESGDDAANQDQSLR